MRALISSDQYGRPISAVLPAACTISMSCSNCMQGGAELDSPYSSSHSAQTTNGPQGRVDGSEHVEKHGKAHVVCIRSVGEDDHILILCSVIHPSFAT